MINKLFLWSYEESSQEVVMCFQIPGSQLSNNQVTMFQVTHTLSSLSITTNSSYFLQVSEGVPGTAWFILKWFCLVSDVCYRYCVFSTQRVLPASEVLSQLCASLTKMICFLLVMNPVYWNCGSTVHWLATSRWWNAQEKGCNSTCNMPVFV